MVRRVPELQRWSITTADGFVDTIEAESIAYTRGGVVAFLIGKEPIEVWAAGHWKNVTQLDRAKGD